MEHIGGEKNGKISHYNLPKHRQTKPPQAKGILTWVRDNVLGRKKVFSPAHHWQGGQTGENTMDWETLFCDVDDFCLIMEPLLRQRQLASGQRRRNRKGRMTASEVMTILIAFHQSHCRTFKHFYEDLAISHKKEFPDLLSYQRLPETPWPPTPLASKFK